jgi:hypothetical protein
MEIQEYRTAVAGTVSQLDAEVNRLVKEGFEPFGTPYYIGQTEGNVDAPFCQAMIRTGPTPSQVNEAFSKSRAFSG